MTGKYKAALAGRGGLLATLRKYGFMRVLDAGLREAWESLGMKILAAMGCGPRQKYGWLAAALSPTCDYWLRYTQVIRGIEEISAGRLPRIVEVASGSRGGISWALNGDKPGNRICLVDYSAELLRDRRGKDAWRVCADGCCLPFPDNSFDVAISLDTVEHLPQSRRGAFFRELQRIAKLGVIVTCPLQSGDGVFQARDFDLDLAQRITSRRGTLPDWLREHLAEGHPTQDEICELLPGAVIKGAENCPAWMRLASLYQRNFLWIFAGIFYLLHVRQYDTQPPYRRALLIWRKNTPRWDDNTLHHSESVGEQMPVSA